VLLGQLLAVGAATLSAWRGGPNALAIAAATFFPSLYLAMPIGALVVLREHEGPAILFLLMLTVMVSDVAQYYSGRLTGRRPLAPTVSPKKTLEGAIGGFAAGALVPVVAGAWWLPQVPVGLRGLLGAGIVTAGIAGDLFESMLKRSAGVKDSSQLIPGHGGMLDRLDSYLFAAPVFYLVAAFRP
jgi:phosphatidate cytidylyltransferase